MSALGIIFLILAVLMGVCRYPVVILSCILLVTTEVRHLFVCFIGYLDILSCKRLVQVFCLFLIGLCGFFFSLIYRSDFYILSKSIGRMFILNIFHPVACIFTLLMVNFDKHQFLTLMKINVTIFPFMGPVVHSLRNIGLP